MMDEAHAKHALYHNFEEHDNVLYTYICWYRAFLLGHGQPAIYNLEGSVSSQYELSNVGETTDLAIIDIQNNCRLQFKAS